MGRGATEVAAFDPVPLRRVGAVLNLTTKPQSVEERRVRLDIAERKAREVVRILAALDAAQLVDFVATTALEEHLLRLMEGR